MDGKNVAVELVTQPFHRDPFRIFDFATWVDEHPGRFINCDENIVLIENVKGSHCSN